MTAPAKDPLARSSDPVLDALDRAPLVSGLTDDQRAELEQDLADVAAGRARLVPHADLPRALEQVAGQRE